MRIKETTLGRRYHDCGPDTIADQNCIFQDVNSANNGPCAVCKIGFVQHKFTKGCSEFKSYPDVRCSHLVEHFLPPPAKSTYKCDRCLDSLPNKDFPLCMVGELPPDCHETQYVAGKYSCHKCKPGFAVYNGECTESTIEGCLEETYDGENLRNICVRCDGENGYFHLDPTSGVCTMA